VKPEVNWNGFNIFQRNIGNTGALDVGVRPYSANYCNAKVVLLLGCEEVQDIPEDAFVVYMGTHGDAGAARADLVLPGATYLEKAGTYVNTDGRVLLTRKVVTPPGRGRSDWEVLRALSEEVGATLPYDSISELRFRIAELAPHLVKYDWVESRNFE